MLTIQVQPKRVLSITPAPTILPSSLSDPQLEEICHRHHNKRGPRSQLRFPNLLRCLVAHTTLTAGTLERHVEEITGLRQAASTLSERRQAMPWVIFEEILRVGLRPLADPTRHPGAFYRGLRLLTQDGTSVPVYNTPDTQRRWQKSKARKGRAAFARIYTTGFRLFRLSSRLCGKGVKIFHCSLNTLFANWRQRKAATSVSRRKLSSVWSDIIGLGISASWKTSSAALS